MAKDRKGKARAGARTGPEAGIGGEALARRWEGRVAEDLGAGPALRADRYIAEVLGLLTRSQLKARDGVIKVNGKLAKPSSLLKGGEALVLEWTEEASLDLVPEAIPLTVLYEDERVIVVDKAQGMVTHPGHGNRRGTLANALLGRLASASFARGASKAGGASPGGGASPARAGIVHRLDKDTSGVMIAAKDAEAQAFLAAQFKDRTTKKEYLAITRGLPRPPEGRIENVLARDPRDRKRFAALPVATPPSPAAPATRADGSARSVGKAAVTDYRVLRSWGPYALVSLRPKTGRTHQLRVHLAGLGCPILGDPIYGKPDPDLDGASLMLHAFRLRISLPGEAEARLFRAPLPERFRRLMAYLDGRWGRNA